MSKHYPVTTWCWSSALGGVIMILRTCSCMSTNCMVSLYSHYVMKRDVNSSRVNNWHRVLWKYYTCRVFPPSVTNNRLYYRFLWCSEHLIRLNLEPLYTSHMITAEVSNLLPNVLNIIMELITTHTRITKKIILLYSIIMALQVIF